MELSREQIQRTKEGHDTALLRPLLSADGDARTLLAILEGLGRLPPEFDSSWLMPLTQHPSDSIRLAAVKNVAKLKNAALLEPLAQQARSETNTLVRRELVSAIGRMRRREAIPILREMLGDPDAKVILQAVRALLCLREEPEAQEALRPLAEHPNELVRAAVRRPARPQVQKGRRTVESPDFLKNLLVRGDARAILRHVPDESVHLTFTSPPYYNARDYALYRSYEDYLDFLTEAFREVHRITKEGRFFVLNTSPVLIPRMSRAHASTRYLIPFDLHPRITQLGFEFIEDIVWLKPDPSAKNRNGGFFQHRKPLGYKANSVVEYVLVYRKKTDKLIDWNIKQYDPETVEASKVLGDYERTNLWKIAPSSDPLHPAVFPMELAARVIQFYSYRGDLVLDPFAGVGTVGQAARSLDRYFFLTEREETYARKAVSKLQEECRCRDFPFSFLESEEFVARHLST